MDIKTVSDREGLLPYLPDWEDLAAAALEPNPFYEHWMLLAALRRFGSGKKLCFLLIFHQPASPSAKPLLCGLFPLERHSRYMGLPMTAWSLWKYPHCFLTTPLIRSGHARETLATLFDWLASKEGRCRMFELRYVPGEGKFHQILTDLLHERGSIPFLWESFTRALFQPAKDGDAYLAAALTSKQRSELRRRARLLSEMGSLQYSVLEQQDDLRAQSESFLRLEAAGWKGREGSAVASKEADRNFFFDIAEEAFRKDRLLMASLTVNGTAVAQHCFFLAGEGAFYFKTGFDEQYAKFAPGFHLECETIRYLHERPDIQWMDTCAGADNELYNRLFLHRRTIQTLLAPVGSGIGELMISSIPLFRSVKRSVHSLIHTVPDKQVQHAG
jgi:hypothetical protein